MFNRSNIPKFKNLNKIEKIIFIISLLFTIISIILMVLYKIKVIKVDIWPFAFAITSLLLSILYFKYDRITSMVGFLLMFLFIGMGLKYLGL